MKVKDLYAKACSLNVEEEDIEIAHYGTHVELFGGKELLVSLSRKREPVEKYE